MEPPEDDAPTYAEQGGRVAAALGPWVDPRRLFADDVVLPSQLPRATAPDSGERRLLRAVLAQALRDASGRPGICPGRPDEPLRAQRDALDWFASASTAPFSFEYVADVLDLDPAAVRASASHWITRGRWRRGMGQSVFSRPPRAPHRVDNSVAIRGNLPGELP